MKSLFIFDNALTQFVLSKLFSGKSSGNQYVGRDIFSRKRQKLRQCIADAVFPDIEKFSLKGLGTVFVQ